MSDTQKVTTALIVVFVSYSQELIQHLFACLACLCGASLCNHLLFFSSDLNWVYCIQVVSSGVYKEYVHHTGWPNHYPLCRPLYALDLDSYTGQDKTELKFTLRSLLQLD